MQIHKKFKLYAFWAIVVISVAGIFLSPTKDLAHQLSTNVPWVAAGIIASEITLTVGFLLMLLIAAPAFIEKLTKSIKNAIEGIFELKEIVSEFDWHNVAKKCNDSKIFWFGFWLSVVGACGDGFVLLAGIGKSLPPASWGLMILPFWDLGLTYVIRRAIHRSVKGRHLAK